MRKITSPSDNAIKVWGRILRVSRQGLEAVEDALKSKGLPPLAWYDLLHEIAEAGDAGIRPFELVDRLLLAQYNVSRLLARLEAAGAIEKLDASEDGRGQYVRITELGREKRRRIWEVYGPMIARLVEAKLPESDLEHLASLLGKLRVLPAD
jgi:DNA-binding MarR family transcriptional regulator